jgi:hypothetical protein
MYINNLFIFVVLKKPTEQALPASACVSHDYSFWLALLSH